MEKESLGSMKSPKWIKKGEQAYHTGFILKLPCLGSGRGVGGVTLAPGGRGVWEGKGGKKG